MYRLNIYKTPSTTATVNWSDQPDLFLFIQVAISPQINPMSDRANKPAGSGHLLRFLSDPKDFSGSTSQDTANKVNPLGWLKKLNRLKDLIKLTDGQILIIAADHLVGKAGIWYDIIGSTATTWTAFTEMFKKKYCAGLEDVYWSQIKECKQLQGETVEDVDVRLRELYSLVNVTDNKMMIRSFLDAIHPRIAYEVERSSEDSAFSRNLEDLVSTAARIESVGLKYQERGVETVSTTGSIIHAPINPSSNTPSVGNQSYAGSDSNTITELLKEFKELKINMINTPRSYSNNSRTLTCFQCGEVGHKKPDCPQIRDSRPYKNNQSPPVSGSNAIPIGSPNSNNNNQAEGSGKAREYHQ